VQIRWTERMYQFLRNNFQRMEDREIADFFTRTCGIKVNVRMVEHARARLGLIKYRLKVGGVRHERVLGLVEYAPPAPSYPGTYSVYQDKNPPLIFEI